MKNIKEEFENINLRSFFTICNMKYGRGMSLEEVEDVMEQCQILFKDRFDKKAFYEYFEGKTGYMVDDKKFHFTDTVKAAIKHSVNIN